MKKIILFIIGLCFIASVAYALSPVFQQAVVSGVQEGGTGGW